MSVSLIGAVPLGDGHLSQFYPSNINLRIVPTPGRNRSIADVVTANLGYALAISKERYDVVHFNVLPGLRTGIPYRIAHQSDARIVVTVHDLPEETAYYGRGTLDRVFSKVHWNLALKQLNFAHLIVTNSGFVKSRLATQVDERKMVVIPNGVDPDFLNFKQGSHQSPLQKTVVCHGTLSPKKGQAWLIRAFASVPNRDGTKLVFVGGGESRYLQELKEYANRCGLGGSVEFLGRRPKSDLLRIVSEATVCVVPSLWEGFGISALEAMALGKPVIASRTGPSDFITSGKDGVLLNPQDTPGLTDALGELLSDAKLRDEMGNRARKKAEGYSWGSIAPLYAGLYRNLKT